MVVHALQAKEQLDRDRQAFQDESSRVQMVLSDSEQVCLHS